MLSEKLKECGKCISSYQDDRSPPMCSNKEAKKRRPNDIPYCAELNPVGMCEYYKGKGLFKRVIDAIIPL